MRQQPRNHTILIVEDDPATCEFLELLLSMAGYHVKTASTGTQGLALGVSAAITAVLLDRRLPDMDGVAVSVALRAHHGSALPILMMTADRDPEVELAARAAGVTAFLRKPFEPPALLERLSAVLSA